MTTRWNLKVELHGDGWGNACRRAKKKGRAGTYQNQSSEQLPTACDTISPQQLLWRRGGGDEQQLRRWTMIYISSLPVKKAHLISGSGRAGARRKQSGPA